MSRLTTAIPAVLRELTGEFSVVMWDAKRRSLVAARDHLGQEPLYYAIRDRGLFVSDRAEGCDPRGAYDLDCIAEFIASRGTYMTRSIHAGVLPVPPGAVISWTHEGRAANNGGPTTPGGIRCDRYWSPHDLPTLSDVGLDEAGAEFRRLFTKAVHIHAESDRKTWTDLSGGLDSSSVTAVGMSALPPDRAIGGSITLRESLSGGNDFGYASAVIHRFGVRNEQILDDWPWRDDGEPAPCTDEPSRDFAFYARDRAVARILRGAGATTLLSGMGPDSYFAGGNFHVADLFYERRFRDGANHLFASASSQRLKVWRAAGHDLVVPFSPAPWRLSYAKRQVDLPPWVRDTFERRHDVRGLATVPVVPAARPGARYRAAVAYQLAQLGSTLPYWRILPGIAVKHPFLYRPLLEFCVRLPATLAIDACRPKPILRAAMAGCLPDEVLRRNSKGTLLTARICWACRKERPLVERLLRSSLLADLGCIEPKLAMEAVDAGARGDGAPIGWLYAMLSLEAWLSTRSGRYDAIRSEY